MSSNEEILEIKFSGGGINPEKLSLGEISSKLKLIHDLIAPIIEEGYPDIDLKTDYLGLMDIGNRSVSFRYKIKNNAKLVLSAFTLLTSSISYGEISNLPPRTIEVLEKTSKFNYKYKTTSSFGKVVNGEFNSLVDFSDEFSVGKIPMLKGVATIYGYVKQIGGDNPKALIVLNDNSQIKAILSREMAMETKIYTYVKIEGVATWKGEELKLTTIEVQDIEPFENLNIEDGFEFLKKELGESWNEVDDPEKYLN